MQVTVRFSSAPSLHFEEEHPGGVRRLPPLFSFHQPPEKAEGEQMSSRSGGQSEARPPALKSSSKLGTHLSTHCSRDERLSRPCPPRE
ncbi:hypothetical protein TNCV_3554541 [Trichonephila clavipes]|nr:hypothetical protein TNCV_3554541 [Trichonephila clavipes]